MLRRPDLTWRELGGVAPGAGAMMEELLRHSGAEEILTQVEIEAKYAGYIEREKLSAQRMHDLEDKRIPASFNFASVTELRKEAAQSLVKFRPGTIGQASRLEGVTPGDLTVLMIYMTGKGARSH